MSSLIPSGWALSKINDTCDVFDSQRIPLNTQERALRKGHYPYYGANGVQGFIDDFIFDGEYVLLAEDGGYFEEFSSRPISYLVSGKFWVNNHAHILQAKKGHETKYIHYSLVHKNILKHINGGTRSKLNQSDMRDIEYLAPPLLEQQKIATILSSVDDVIEKTRAQIDKLKDLKTGMMQELLTKGIGHTEFKDSPVGRIPVEWTVTTLGETGKWKGGGTPSKSNKEFWSGNIPWVSPKDMKFEFIKKTEDYITSRAISESSTNLVSAGSILIVVRSGILKHTLPVAIASLDLTLNQDMKALTVSESFSALYIYQYLLANNHKVLRATLKAGNTVESLDFYEFSNYLIPCPPINEQHEIATIVESIAERIRAKKSILKGYAIAKKALMQDLLTGKVRVKLTDKESAVV